MYQKLTLILLIAVLAGCNASQPVDRYSKDNADCQRSSIDYHDCMRERGYGSPKRK